MNIRAPLILGLLTIFFLVACGRADSTYGTADIPAATPKSSSGTAPTSASSSGMADIPNATPKSSSGTAPTSKSTPSESTPTPRGSPTLGPIEECPGFEIEREIILRAVPQRLASGDVFSTQSYSCFLNGFSAVGTVSPGHDYGVSVTSYGTEEEAKAALGAPNTTFQESPAVHSYRSRNGGFINESLDWQKSRWVFRASSFDDTSFRLAPPYAVSERMYDAAVDLGLYNIR